jgi:hypothetical protein
MSGYRVSKMTEEHELEESVKFDKKEDAEHYAKNQSTIDTQNIFEVQKNNDGNFFPIKTYRNGEVLEA